MNWQEIFQATATLFFIMDPIGNLPIFTAILKKQSPKEQSKIICRELIFALLILLVFLYVGTRFLDFLGLSPAAFSLSGAIILFLIALKVIFYQPILGDYSEEKGLFIVPLATPLIAGPSAIAFLLLISSSKPDLIWEWTLALIFSWLGVCLVLIFAPLLIKIFGKSGLQALEKLMGMLLIIIAVQLFLDGLELYLSTILK